MGAASCRTISPAISSTLAFSDREKARMHDLAVRNQAEALMPAEKEELLAFRRVGDVLAILNYVHREAPGADHRWKPRSELLPLQFI
jgi:hypothetical protein